MDLYNQNGAIFSEDRRYRYLLWRQWDESKEMMMFIGLNPSTASEDQDDPTIRRVKKFSNTFGFGGVYMMNLFGLVTAYPELLKLHPDPVGDNDYWLRWVKKMMNGKGMVLFAWGNFKQATERAKEVSAMFPGAYCLAPNADGSPKHPLYVRGDTKPILYKS